LADICLRAFSPVGRRVSKLLAAPTSAVPLENEQRVLGKDGRYRWFLIRYKPLLDENGKVIRWYATGTDIDDRKRAEDRMRNESVALRKRSCAIYERRLFVHFYGVINYKDGFERERETSFRYRWEVTDFPRFNGHPWSRWEVCGHPEDNRET